MKIQTLIKPILLIATICVHAAITSCSQQPVKKGINNTQVQKYQKSSISKVEREKYRDGITALYNNELSKAQRIFIEFIRSKPKLAGGYSNLALVYFKKNEFSKSYKQVSKALTLNPKQAQALNLRAQLYVTKGEIHKAKIDYLKAISIKPKYINAQYNIALLYDIYLQDIALAIKHYKIYISLLKTPDEATQEWLSHLEGILKDA